MWVSFVESGLGMRVIGFERETAYHDCDELGLGLRDEATSKTRMYRYPNSNARLSSKTYYFSPSSSRPATSSPTNNDNNNNNRLS